MLQDYSGQNLRGRSFKGQNLTWTNFSYADIRGADFTGANLSNANFSNAKAGLQKRWAIFLVFAWILMGLSGFLSAFAGVLMASLVFDPNEGSSIAYHLTGWAVIVILTIFFFVTICQGIQAGIVSIAGTVVFAVAVAVTGAFAGTFTGAYAVAGAGAVAGALAASVAGGIAKAVAGAIAGAVFLLVPVTIVFAGAYAGAFASAFDRFLGFSVPVPINGAGAIVIAIVVALFNIYISWRALKGDPKYTLIYTVAIAFAAIGGTSFRSSDLTDADFTMI